MAISYQSIILYLSQIIWPLARISGLFLAMPLISSVLLPRSIRIIFAFTLALLVMPFIPQSMSFLYFKLDHLFFLINELLLGLLMGFVLQLVFQIFIIGGQIIAMQAGLGFAVMVDPASKASVPLVSQLYLIMVSLLFLALNGHLALLEIFLDSFRIKPIGQFNVGIAEFSSVLGFSAWMMKESVLVSLPAILSLLLVSLAFGVMSRVAPQLNLFSIGFPITLLMGFIIIRFSLPGLFDQMADSIEQGLTLIKGMLH
ncbi:flagellar biosynthetic protein fliR [Legionella birminghamensis]|uniref:Flagellar biosynthetic protein FliR n=1 Tax=Legionella birminghamensis TaxID=28083 RepID=A0A378I8B0_9GAMM|nr:flagellar biosynthetic protein FliR [Legionella birminghamensis]KTC68008.1 flagellar biosynthetic protein fliR [Legionella birminghamensis]STX31283.1 flagellar biosynthetic protein FliR [Legionella birminghamensis]